VRVDLPGRSLVDVIRDHDHATRESAAWSLADRYYGRGYPGIRSWPVLAGEGRSVPAAVTWKAVGSTTFGSYALDRYRLDHEGLVLPLVHVHPASGAARDGGTTGGPRPVVLDFGLAGKAGPAEWPSLLRHLEQGRDVVTLDPRGLGETRMRYRATSIDDPDLAPADEAEAYASPLSGVLANYAYNALLLGRPYLFDVIEDVEIAARFSRAHLGAREVRVSGREEAAVIAAAAADVLDRVEAVPAPGESAGSLEWWAQTLESGRETWPIHLLLPGGATLRPSR
jgi:hypothetical protein